MSCPAALAFLTLCLGAEVITELDAVAGFSEIVPDTVVFDDFER
jgi:hypothetical protein